MRRVNLRGRVGYGLASFDSTTASQRVLLNSARIAIATTVNGVEVQPRALHARLDDVARDEADHQ